jgi:hypothetical protein
MDSFSIKKKLMNQKLICRSRLDFRLNKTSRKIVHMEEKMDFVTAFSELLRDPKITAIVLQDALLTEDGVVGPTLPIGHSSHSTTDTVQQPQQTDCEVRNNSSHSSSSTHSSSSSHSSPSCHRSEAMKIDFLLG